MPEIQFKSFQDEKKHSTASTVPLEIQQNQSCNSNNNNASKCECLSTNIAVFLAIVSALSVLLLANYLYFGLTCRGKHNPNSINSTQFFTEKIHWDGAVRLTIEEKNITLLRTMAKHRCYILPRTSASAVVLMRKLQLVREIIDENDKLNVLGGDGKKFCSDDKIYLLEALSEGTRQKRDSTAAGDPLQLSYEKRSPRCVDLILDCAEGEIGEVRSCYTWINGAMTMKQTCLSQKEFKITLTKPTGRIMKVQREQALICFERRQNGLRC
jgi:hypothetical protein